MGAKLPKYLLILLNFAVFLCGGIIFVSGLLLKLESGFLEDEVKTLFNRISYNGVYMGTLADGLSYMMMAFGGVLMVVAILGGCGAWNKVRPCLLIYVIFIILMIVAQGVLVGFWISARTRANEWLKGRMLDLLKSYEGPTKTDDISAGWNTLFMTPFSSLTETQLFYIWVEVFDWKNFHLGSIYAWFTISMLVSVLKGMPYMPIQTGIDMVMDQYDSAECCGVNAQYASGGTNNDFSELDVTWWNSDRSVTEVIPATCCQGVTSSTISNYVDSATCTQTPKNFYTAGCYDRVKEYIYTFSLMILITVAITFAVEVTAIICSCLVMSAINKITHA